MNVWMIVAFLLVFLVGIICIYTTCHIVFDDWDVLEKLFLSTSFTDYYKIHIYKNNIS